MCIQLQAKSQNMKQMKQFLADQKPVYIQLVNISQNFTVEIPLELHKL